MNKKIISILFKMLVIIISGYLITYAWFIEIDKLNISGIFVGAKKTNSIQISLDNGATWKNIADLNIADEFLFEQLVTSEGVNFNYAYSKLPDGTPINFAPAIVNKHYLEYQILVKSQFATGIFLKNSSYVYPEAGNEEGQLLGYDVPRKSLYGDFTKDLIAGAVRVSFVENDLVGETYIPQTTTKMVWAPNKEYKVTCVETDCTAVVNSTDTQDYNFIKVTSAYVFNEDRVSNLKETISADNVAKTSGGDPMLLYLNDDETKSLTIRVWVEGNDREAVTATKGGLFKMSFSFAGISKTLNNTPPSVTADQDTNTIIGYSSTMEYSKDYGNTWITYQTENNPIIEENKTIYVRQMETAGAFPSTITELNF